MGWACCGCKCDSFGEGGLYPANAYIYLGIVAVVISILLLELERKCHYGLEAKNICME